MKKILQTLVYCQLFYFTAITLAAQSLQPFTNCPNVSVAITRPGFNATPGAYQIYLIDSNGAIQSAGHPINLKINGFGLNSTDGFLYGLHESSNVINPFLTRVDKNGNFENVGTLTPPPADPFKLGIINTAAGTMDDKDNYYFIAFVTNLQNVEAPPELFVGKIKNVSTLVSNDNPIAGIKYSKIDPGSCADELFAALANPNEGALQDIAFNAANGNIYTFIPAPGVVPTTGKIGWFNPNISNPVFTCIDPVQPNIPTNDLSGLFFANNNSLFILTIDGKYYKADVNTGVVSFVSQSSLPLTFGNLRGDMASCVGKKHLVPFNNCPGVSVAITRPGINSTMSPYQIFLIDNAGNVQPSGNPVNLQINAFGLNNKDGFLYGMHESRNVIDPFFSRVDKNGDFEDIGKLTAPPASGTMIGFINTAAATIDGNDNYYFTAIVADTPVSTTRLPRLFLGTIKNISKLKEGDVITIAYKEIRIGTCADEILQVLSNPSNGLLQDISYDPVNNNIYTIIPAAANLPAPAKIAFFNPHAAVPVLNCINTIHPNIPIIDFSGLYSDNNGRLFILTIDGKFYRGNVNNGVITLVTQTTLPLLGNNLRGDMASCVRKKEHHDGDDDDDDDDHHHDKDRKDESVRIASNPVQQNQMTILINAGENTRVQMQIAGSTGNPVQSKTIFLTMGANQFNVDVSLLNKGLYSVILTYPSGKRTATKFVRL
jgi:hypothetical protein